MKQIPGVITYAAIIAGVTLSLAASPAPAQTLGGYHQGCQYIGGRWVCPRADWGGGTGTRAYERWDNGSPASGFSGSSSNHQYPYTMGSYRTWYGFGR